MKIVMKSNLALAAVGGMLASLTGCGASAAPVMEVPGAPNETPPVAAAPSAAVARPVASGAQPAGVGQGAQKMSCSANMNMGPLDAGAR